MRSSRNIADNSLSMNVLLRDFCAHQFWADAEHWRAIEAHSAAAADAAIRSRLHHIHQVQRGEILWLGQGGTGSRLPTAQANPRCTR